MEDGPALWRGDFPTMSVDDERTPDESSPDRRALEARIVELEGQLAAARGGPSVLALTAMRIAADGWGEGWVLRPSPARGTGWTSRRTLTSASPW